MMIINIIYLLLSIQFNNDLITKFDNDEIVSQSSAFNLIVFINMNDCSVCMNEIESFNRLRFNLSPKDLNIMGVLNSENVDDLIKFKKKYKININTIGSTEIFSKYNIEKQKTPYAILIDTYNDKKIVYHSFPKKVDANQKTTMILL